MADAEGGIPGQKVGGVMGTVVGRVDSGDGEGTEVGGIGLVAGGKQQDGCEDEGFVHGGSPQGARV